MDNINIQQPKEKKGGIATFLLGFFSVLILVGALGGVGYYYFIKQKKIPSQESVKPVAKEDVKITQKKMESKEMEISQPSPKVSKSESISEPTSKEIDELIKQIGIKNNQIKILQEENANLKKQTNNIVQKLNYVIKPKNKLVVECYSAPNGKWNIPQECAKTLISNVQAILKEDKKIVALEVSGVVDEQKYRGLSPELKQEGLASFRAKSVIEYLKKSLPTITTFEGLSIQQKGKRGYFIRAYYVE